MKCLKVVNILRQKGTSMYKGSNSNTSNSNTWHDNDAWKGCDRRLAHRSAVLAAFKACAGARPCMALAGLLRCRTLWRQESVHCVAQHAAWQQACLHCACTGLTSTKTTLQSKRKRSLFSHPFGRRQVAFMHQVPAAMALNPAHERDKCLVCDGTDTQG